MRKFTKLFALLLSVMCFTSIFSGCNNKGVKIDHTKTQLYVSNYDAGIGRTWIEGIGKSFEQAFAEYSFQEGRKGVQVIYNHNRTTSGLLLESKIAGLSENVFFTEGIDYPSLVSNDLLYDVSSIMNDGAVTGVDENGNVLKESVPIKDKIDDMFLSYLDRSGNGSGYYAFPYYLALKGAIYDRELWNDKCYYLLRGGCPSDYVAIALDPNMDGVVNQEEVDLNALAQAKISYETEIQKLKNGQHGLWSHADERGVRADLVGTANERVSGLSAGPDGRFNTQDDGLPATHEEFYLLLDDIVKSNVSPIIYAGKFPGYAESFTTNLWWIHEGAENLRTFYSLNGTIDDLAVIENGAIKKDSFGNVVTESKTFNGGQSDGYEAQRMVGKYYALEFANKLSSKSRKWLNKEVDNTALSHISAQSVFLTSVLTNERIAMLIDGSWWQQESSQTFTTMTKKDSKYSKANRDIAMMTLPNATIERFAEKAITGEKNVSVAMNDSFCVINGNLDENSPQLAVAKMFVSYVNNDAMLNKFTEYTSMFRGLNYEIAEDTMDNVSKYGKHLVKYVEATDIVYPYSDNTLVIKNYGYLSNKADGWNWHTLATKGNSSIELQYPVSGMRIQTSVTAQDYFLGLYNYQKNIVWPKLVK